ncbi:aldo/keto reductase [soil metagenome]
MTIPSPTFTIGGDLTVNRLGYGAMQLPGQGVWGPTADKAGALAVLRRAVELGVDFIDTANSYGPYVADELIAEALKPYDGITIATKAGLLRTGPGEWHPLGRPEYLRQEAELTRWRLGVDRLDLFQLHRIDPSVPREEQFGVLKELQDEGVVRHVGLSEVSVEELDAAREVLPIATVQNRYNLTDRASEAVLERCTELGIGFIPWFPIATGELAKPGGPVDHLVEETGATPSQIALAWLLQRSPVILPIPGTKSIDHLEDNLGASEVELTAEQVATLDAVA